MIDFIRRYIKYKKLEKIFEQEHVKLEKRDEEYHFNLDGDDYFIVKKGRVSREVDCGETYELINKNKNKVIIRKGYYMKFPSGEASIYGNYTTRFNQHFRQNV